MKITVHKKKQENKTHNEEKNQSVETNLDVTEMMGFKDKDFKTSILNLIHKWKDIQESLTS